jgi:hypothetical protein
MNASVSSMKSNDFVDIADSVYRGKKQTPHMQNVVGTMTMCTQKLDSTVNWFMQANYELRKKFDRIENAYTEIQQITTSSQNNESETDKFKQAKQTCKPKLNILDNTNYSAENILNHTSAKVDYEDCMLAVVCANQIQDCVEKSNSHQYGRCILTDPYRQIHQCRGRVTKTIQRDSHSAHN